MGYHVRELPTRALATMCLIHRSLLLLGILVDQERLHRRLTGPHRLDGTWILSEQTRDLLRPHPRFCHMMPAPGEENSRPLTAVMANYCILEDGYPRKAAPMP